jgi:hypothetical protein
VILCFVLSMILLSSSVYNLVSNCFVVSY